MLAVGCLALLPTAQRQPPVALAVALAVATGLAAAGFAAHLVRPVGLPGAPAPRPAARFLFSFTAGSASWSVVRSWFVGRSGFVLLSWSAIAERPAGRARRPVH